MSQAAAGFVHLHVHSYYSLLTGVGSPADIAKKSANDGAGAVAITDYGNMHGVVDLYKACEKNGIKPILGYDAYVALRSRFDKEPMDAQSFQLVLLAKNDTGYQNLLALSTEANLSGMFYRARVDKDLLKKHREGVIALSGGLQGEIAQSIVKGDTEAKTKQIIKEYHAIFGEDFYLEVQRHPITRRELQEVEERLKKYSAELGIPLAATNDVHYPTPDYADAQDIVTCIRDNGQRNDPNRVKMLGDDFSLRTPDEMLRIFADLPEACANTVKIAEQCQVSMEFGKYLLPPFPVPEGQTVDEYLREVCLDGVQSRYDFNPRQPKTEEQTAIVDRLDLELGIIQKMGFPAYFLIVWDFVKWAKEQGIAVGPGRGSAAGSLVSYALRITNIDPIKYDLLFERFLNPERISMPDIDIDFADDRRDEVLHYVRELYGDDRVAQVCTFGTLAARAAIKDVGRVLGLGFAEMNLFAKLIPERPGITLDEALEQAPDLKKALKENPRFQEIWNIAKRLEGSVRHVSVHACAVVISPDAITKHVPLQRAPKDEQTIITQFSQKPVEDLGLLKMDFLGLKNLTILVDTLKIIQERTDEIIDLDEIPLDDEKTFKLLTKGQTTGVFQLESAGMRRYLKELKPTNLEDIIAMVSLYRPGPMEWIPDYISGKHGKKEVKYLHESLRQVLDKTFGIAIYQEQILQIAQVFAGFTLGQADLLRRAIGKKIASELAAQREKFIEGAKAKGHSEQMAVQIFDKVIEPFAGYGFNKSHAAGYAMIAYQTAYLKANYSTEFMTALLAADRNNTDRVVIDIEECRELGIEVLPPSVNESGTNFTALADGVIRFGLGAIKGVGDSVVESIVKARGTEPFASLADFAARAPSKVLNKKSLEALAKSGALSTFTEANQVIEHFKLISDFSKGAEKDTAHEAQDSLFGDDGIDHVHELILPESTPATLAEKLSWERETLGLFVSDHPLRSAKALFRKKGVLIGEIEKKNGKKATAGGILLSMRKLITKTQKQMAIMSIEDPTGKLEVAVFPKSYEKLSDKLVERDDAVYWVTGKVENRIGAWQIIADKIELQELKEIEKIVATMKPEREEDDLLAPETGEMEEDGDTFTAESGFEVTPDSEETEEADESAETEGAKSPNQEVAACPNKNEPWKITLKPGFKKTCLKALHKELLKYPGPCPVEIHALGQVFYPEFGVEPTPELKAVVAKFT